jgi:hypothetical protein
VGRTLCIEVERNASKRRVQKKKEFSTPQWQNTPHPSIDLKKRLENPLGRDFSPILNRDLIFWLGIELPWSFCSPS